MGSNAEKYILSLYHFLFSGAYYSSQGSNMLFPSTSHIMKKCFNVKLLHHHHTDRIKHCNIPTFRIRRLKPNLICHKYLFFFSLVIIQQRTKFSDSTFNEPTDQAQLSFIRRENLSKSVNTIRIPAFCNLNITKLLAWTQCS